MSLGVVRQLARALVQQVLDGVHLVPRDEHVFGVKNTLNDAVTMIFILLLQKFDGRLVTGGAKTQARKINPYTPISQGKGQPLFENILMKL